MNSIGSILLAGLIMTTLGFPGLVGSASAQDLLGLPGYPQSQRIRINGQLSTNNVPIEANTFNTTDDLRTVMAYYQKALKKRGLKVVVHNFGLSKGYVGYFDANSGTMRLATVMSDPVSHGCMIILSSMDPRPLLDTKLSLPEGLPTVPGAHNLVFNTSTEQGSSSQVVTYRAAGTIATVRTALLRSANEIGWQPSKSGKHVTGGINLQRSRSTCMIRLTEDNANPQQAAVLVNMVVMTPTADRPRSTR